MLAETCSLTSHNELSYGIIIKHIQFFLYKVMGYPNFQRLSRVLLGDLDLNILKSVSRHLYKHTGTKMYW